MTTAGSTSKPSSKPSSTPSSTPSSEIVVASFDIGKVNFASYVEKFTVPLTVDSALANGEMIDIEVIDVSTQGSSKFDMVTRRRLNAYLETKRKIWDCVDIFLVEQQFFKGFTRGKGSFGTRASAANVDAIKIGEFLVSWLICRYGVKDIRYFSSTFKTQTLGAPKAMTKPERKRWAIGRARTLFVEDRKDERFKLFYQAVDDSKRKRRNEERIQEILDSDGIADLPLSLHRLLGRHLRERQKLDDVSDCVLQLQAWKITEYLP